MKISDRRLRVSDSPKV